MQPCGAPTPHEPATKWQAFYDAGFLPWNTDQPASQLAAYLTTCPAAALGRGEFAPQALQLPPPFVLPALVAAADGASQQPSAERQQQAQQHTQQQAQQPLAYHRCAACAQLKPPPGGEALEIGCGTGASTILLAALGWRAAGVDIAPAAVAAARARAAAAGVSDRCTFVVADALALPAGFDWEAAKALELRQVAAAAGGGNTGAAALAAVGDAAVAAAAAAAAASEAAVGTGVGGGGVSTGVAAAGGAAKAEAGGKAGDGGQGHGAFDLITDVQAFHVLFEQAPAAAPAALARLLRRGGVLSLLTGNALEPYCGPNVLTECQLRAAFAGGGWEFVWLTQSRFDETRHYREELGKRPLAWWALLRRL